MKKYKLTKNGDEIVNKPKFETFKDLEELRKVVKEKLNDALRYQKKVDNFSL